MLKRKLSDSFILAGSGRSGTTWISDIMTANPNARVVFEPFDGRRVPEAKVLPLRPYARPNGNYPKWRAFVEQVLLGNIENDWTMRQNHRWWATRRLVKVIRANLMLGWMTEQFHVPTVLITRHPCAVVSSRLKLKWDSHLDVFLNQEELVEDHLSQFLSIIHDAQSDLEKHTIMWCVENLVPLRQLKQNNWIFCTYEGLVTDPEAEAERILSGLNIRQTMFNRKAIHKVSQVSRPDSAIANQRDPLTEWQRQLSVDEIKTILDLVQTFGISLYDDDPLPHLDQLFLTKAKAD